MSDENAYGRGGRFQNAWRRQQAWHWQSYNEERRTRREEERLEQHLAELSPLEQMVEREFGMDRLLEAIRIARSFRGHGSGQSGVTFEDIDRSDLFAVIRETMRALKSGEYRPAPERTVEIPRPGKSPRRLSLGEITDRAVAMVANERFAIHAEQPFLEHESVQSIGYRTRRRVWDTIINIERAIENGLTAFVAADIRDAFNHVPISEAVDAVREQIDDEYFVQIVESLLRGHEQKTVGVSQGSPIGPTGFNLALDRIHDRPFAEYVERRFPAADFPSRPICIRYADDLLYMGQADQLLEPVRFALSLLLDAGMPTGRQVDSPEHPPVVLDLRVPGTSITFVGFTHRIVDGRLQTGPSRKSWGKIHDLIRSSHDGPSPYLHAEESVTGWIKQFGPGFGHTRELPSQAARLCGFLENAEFGGLLSQSDLVQQMQQSHELWRQYRTDAWSRFSV